VTEEESGLVLTQKSGNLKLFLSDLDDLHQWDFVSNQKLRASLRAIDQQRESWKRRALLAEAKLAESANAIGTYAGGQNVSDFRFAALKRYLAKQFHPDFAPGHGIEKIVRGEIFKEIWGEVDRIHQQSAPAWPRTRSFSAGGQN
jgi:hypothetical protein